MKKIILPTLSLATILLTTASFATIHTNLYIASLTNNGISTYFFPSATARQYKGPLIAQIKTDGQTPQCTPNACTKTSYKGYTVKLSRGIPEFITFKIGKFGLMSSYSARVLTPVIKRIGKHQNQPYAQYAVNYKIDAAPIMRFNTANTPTTEKNMVRCAKTTKCNA